MSPTLGFCDDLFKTFDQWVAKTYSKCAFGNRLSIGDQAFTQQKDVSQAMDGMLKTYNYYATVEVDGDWSRGKLSKVFGVEVRDEDSVAILNGWIADSSNPNGLLMKIVLAHDFAKFVRGEKPASFATGHCFIPWRYVRYVAYLENQETPESLFAQHQQFGFLP